MSTGVHPPTPKSASFPKAMRKICVVRGQGTTYSTKGSLGVFLSRGFLLRVVSQKELGEPPKDPSNEGVSYLIYLSGVELDERHVSTIPLEFCHMSSRWAPLGFPGRGNAKGNWRANTFGDRDRPAADRWQWCVPRVWRSTCLFGDSLAFYQVGIR